MRVTLGTQTDAAAARMREATSRLLEAQMQLTSGKRINKPSDDVTATGRAMNIRSMLRSLAQFAENNNSAKNSLDSVEAALGNISNEIQQLRQAALQSGASTLSTDAKQGIVAQIKAIRTRLLDLAGTQVLDSYIFSGHKTDTPPIVETGGDPPYAYQGDSGAVTLRVQAGTTIQINVTGDQLFNFGGAAVPGVRDLLTLTHDMESAVISGDVSAASDLLNDLDANLTNVLGIRAQIGARTARLEANSTALAESTSRMQALLSSTEDIDLTQAVIQLKTRENLYEAALAVASRIIQNSLVNYINR